MELAEAGVGAVEDGRLGSAAAAAAWPAVGAAGTQLLLLLRVLLGVLMLLRVLLLRVLLWVLLLLLPAASPENVCGLLLEAEHIPSATLSLMIAALQPGLRQMLLLLVLLQGMGLLVVVGRWLG